MKRCLIIIVAFLFIIVLQAQELPILVFAPLESKEGVKRSKTELYTETLRTYLIQSNRLSLIDDTTGSGEELNLVQATRLGIENKADLVLYGSVSTSGDDLFFNVTLLQPVTQENLLADQIASSDQTFEKDLKLLSERIVQQAGMVSLSSIAYIKAYAEAENWERAWELYSSYKRAYTESDPEIDALGARISQRLAAEEFADSRSFLNAGFFDKARRSIARAIELDQKQKEYPELQKEIEVAAAKFETERKEILLETVRQLIEQERYTGADNLLTEIETAGFAADLGVIKLRDETDSGLLELKYYADSREAFKNQDYTRARLSIQKALQMNPDKIEYLTFKTRVEARELKDRRNQETWDRYSEELSDLDSFSLFVKSKKPFHFETAAYTHTTLLSTASSGSSLQEEKQVMHGVELSYTRFFTAPWKALRLDSEVFSIYPTVTGSISAATGSKKHAATAGGVLEHGGTSLLVGGGGGVSLQAFSFIAGTGLYLQTGAYDDFTNLKFPDGSGSDSSSDDWYYTLGIGPDIWLSWMPFSNWQFMLRYRYLFSGLWGPEEIVDPRYSLLSFGVGLKAF